MNRNTTRVFWLLIAAGVTLFLLLGFFFVIVPMFQEHLLYNKTH